MSIHVAVIGAGLSGLACAAELQKAGVQVTVFEKSRGPGGRSPTRWVDREAKNPVGFDHGTQYFHVRSKSFRQIIDRAAEQGAVAPWSGRVVNLAYGSATPIDDDEVRWVGTPGMAALGKFLAQGLSIQLNSRVVGVRSTAQGHILSIQTGESTADWPVEFNWVVSAMPCEQVQQLFAGVHTGLAAEAAKVRSSVNWTTMLTFSEPLPVDYAGAFVYDSPLGWVCRDSSKPGRAGGERWVIQATAEWSEAHSHWEPDDVSEMLIDVFRNATGLSFLADKAVSHRWLYSLPTNPLDCNYLLFKSEKLGACGDWLSKARVEDAFLSGQSLAAELRTYLLE